MLDDDRPLSIIDQPFLQNALETVKLRFIRSEEDFSRPNLDEYPPEFAHQHFGESETIFGYQNLSVAINYTAASLFIYPEIKFTRTSLQGGSSIEPDDIYERLKSQLPTGQFFIMVKDKKEFMQRLNEQKDFIPFGELVCAIKGNSDSNEEDAPSSKRMKIDCNTFEMYKVTEESESIDLYISQLQTLALWYIDAAGYTDNSEGRWIHYILFETYNGIDEDGNMCKRYAVAGYCSTYRFYHHPNEERIRIAHLLLLPAYRSSGMGAKFFKAINEDLWKMPNLYDITIEDAADAMIYLRDYLDCMNCEKLPEFSRKCLENGFSKEMKDAARQHFKIHHKQARRIYEILRYKATNKNNIEDLKRYRIDVKRRLEKPFKRRAKDWNKMNEVLDQATINQLTVNESPEVKFAQLSSLYDETIKGYEVVINRLEEFPVV